jgi:hypothetical protein
MWSNIVRYPLGSLILHCLAKPYKESMLFIIVKC